MINPTFRGGRTLRGAKETLKYLLDSRVKDGTAVLLEGSVKITESYIEQASKKQKWSWSSGVLTFSETLTPQQEADVIAKFKEVTFPGMTPEQYDMLIVRHIDKDRTELHYIIPRLHLTTGLSFNPYFVHRDIKKKDLFQDFINLKYGFTQWQDNLSMKKKPPIWSKKAKKEDIRKAFDEALEPLITDETIRTREELIYQLSDWGYELNRQGKEYISVIDEQGKNHRLKGKYYGEAFEYGIRGIEEEIRRSKSKTIDGTDRTVAAVGKQLDLIVEQQAGTNRERYKKRDSSQQRTTPSNEKTARKDHQNVAAVMEKDARAEEPASENQRRLDDRTRTEAIGRIRTIREATNRRTGSSASRAEGYTAAVITDSDDLESRVRAWGRAKLGRTITEVLKRFVVRLPDLVREFVLEQVKARQAKEKELAKTVPLEEKRDPIQEKKEEIVQPVPVIEGTIDQGQDGSFGPDDDVGIKGIL